MYSIKKFNKLFKKYKIFVLVVILGLILLILYYKLIKNINKEDFSISIKNYDSFDIFDKKVNIYRNCLLLNVKNQLTFFGKYDNNKNCTFILEEPRKFPEHFSIVYRDKDTQWLRYMCLPAPPYYNNMRPEGGNYQIQDKPKIKWYSMFQLNEISKELAAFLEKTKEGKAKLEEAKTARAYNYQIIRFSKKYLKLRTTRAYNYNLVFEVADTMYSKITHGTHIQRKNPYLATIRFPNSTKNTNWTLKIEDMLEYDVVKLDNRPGGLINWQRYRILEDHQISIIKETHYSNMFRENKQNEIKKYKNASNNQLIQKINSNINIIKNMNIANIGDTLESAYHTEGCLPNLYDYYKLYANKNIWNMEKILNSNVFSDSDFKKNNWYMHNNCAYDFEWYREVHDTWVGIDTWTKIVAGINKSDYNRGFSYNNSCPRDKMLDTKDKNFRSYKDALISCIDKKECKSIHNYKCMNSESIEEKNFILCKVSPKESKSTKFITDYETNNCMISPQKNAKNDYGDTIKLGKGQTIGDRIFHEETCGIFFSHTTKAAHYWRGICMCIYHFKGIILKDKDFRLWEKLNSKEDKKIFIKRFLTQNTSYKFPYYKEHDQLNGMHDYKWFESRDIPQKGVVPYYEFAFDGECKPDKDKEYKMYNGNGDNIGSLKEKTHQCYTKCKEKQKTTPDIKGFIVRDSGRCWCEENDTKSSTDCKRTESSKGGYKRYNMKEFDYNKKEFEFAFDGECKPDKGKEYKMYSGNGDNIGSLKEKTHQCYTKCKEKQKTTPNIKGFIVRDSGRCWCEENDTKSSTDCKRTEATHLGYKRYNFQTNNKEFDYNKKEFEFVFNGECKPDKDKEYKMYNGNGDNIGTLEEKTHQCYTKCKEKQKTTPNIKGFIVRDSGRCWCEENDTKSSTDCKRTESSKGGYKRYNFLE